MIYSVYLDDLKDRLGRLLDVFDVLAVLSTHAFLDSGMLVTGGMKAQWNNWVPVKLNILMWHINLDSILTKKRLSAVSISRVWLAGKE